MPAKPNLFVRLQAPFRERTGRFSPLKTATLVLLLWPAVSILFRLWLRRHGPVSLPYYIYWSGVWATAILMASLAVTPARRIFGISRLIVVRRMIGVVGLLYLGAHFYVDLVLDRFDLKFILFDFSGFSIQIGLVSTLGFLALGLTSFDAAIAKMGAKRWTTLHALTYPMMALAMLHFLLSRDSLAGLPFLMNGIFFWLMGWRLLNRFGRGTDPRALLVLGLVVPALSLAFEVTWLALYQGIKPLETIGYTFDFTYDPDSFNNGLAPTWQLLILGLIIAALPVALRRQKSAASVISTRKPAEA